MYTNFDVSVKFRIARYKSSGASRTYAPPKSGTLNRPIPYDWTGNSISPQDHTNGFLGALGKLACGFQAGRMLEEYVNPVDLRISGAHHVSFVNEKYGAR